MDERTTVFSDPANGDLHCQTWPGLGFELNALGILCWSREINTNPENVNIVKQKTSIWVCILS